MVKILRGPRWSARAEPVLPDSGVTDHGDKQLVRFLVFGDSGTGGVDQHRVAGHMAQECGTRGGCDFALVLGDNVYPVGVRKPRPDESLSDTMLRDRFELPYAELRSMEFWLVPGNHDWYTHGSVERQVRYTTISERWRMPSHDYAIPRLPDWIHIYGLDTVSVKHGRLTGQVERAAEALCEQPGWRLLYGHNPIYSSGPHTDRHGEDLKIKQRLLEPLIARCDVNVYFAGHDHHQEHISAPDFEQVVQGAAAKLRRVRPGVLRDPEVNQLAAASRLGFGLVEATPEWLELRFFGYGESVPYGEFHCRRIHLEGFSDPNSRSTPCDPGEKGDRPLLSYRGE